MVLASVRAYGDLVIYAVVAQAAGGNNDWADLYCETTGYGFAFPHRCAAVGGNCDFADETEEAG